MNEFEKAAKAIEARALPEACSLLATWLATHPDSMEARELHALTLAELGRSAEAIAAFREVVARSPERGRAFYNLGTLLVGAGQWNEALTALRAAAKLEPDRSAAFVNLGHAARLVGALDEAENACRQAVTLEPESASGWLNLGNVLKDQSRIRDAIEAYHRASAVDPSNRMGASNALLAHCYVDADPAVIAAEHRAFGEKMAAAVPERPLSPRPPGHRLRVGYLSADFRWHSVSRFFGTVLSHHDRRQFDIHLYSDVEHPDAVTRLMERAATCWVDVLRMSDEALCDRIRADGVDVLIDLAGHTGRRLAVFARRAAPVQVTWLGYPFSTGLRTMDYRITDAIADPPGAEAWQSERLLRLPGPFLCYQAPDDAPPVSAAPCQSNGRVTFASFNHLSKLSDATVVLFSAVLRACPEARLVLKCASLSDDATRRQTEARFAARGIDPERLVLAGRTASAAEHLSVYSQVDIGLDPFPYHGTTTTMEALWMGVPVITMTGYWHASRVGTSLLTHLGLASLAASNPTQFVQVASSLAGNVPGLVDLRARLRSALRQSPLCDEVAFTRGFEQALIHASAEKRLGAGRGTSTGRPSPPDTGAPRGERNLG